MNISSHDAARIEGDEHGVIACSLERRAECRLMSVGGKPRLHMGSLCGLRRIYPGLAGSYTESDFWLDIAAPSARYGSARVNLARTEFVILAAIVAGHGAFVSLGRLAAALWGEVDDEQNTSVVEHSLKLVCKRLRLAGFPTGLFEVNPELGARFNTQAGR